ncbi:MFS general substrate transporter [Lecanosticta acicola]|uniref:MFS general substrate transporter n=1 Tax=Lecanosticta acicola TaxID=111012 RepID=A0AAI8Z631_9PEZI|nr:MFS general substrate transporter [Lecanosticta acicola]
MAVSTARSGNSDEESEKNAAADLEEKPSPDASPICPVKALEADEEEDNNVYKPHAGEEQEEIDPSEEKRVLRKIDLRLIPVLWLIYLLQYLDKNGINYASVYGLEEGTKLHGQQYSWLSSIFYFGYLAGQFPASYLMQRLPIGKFLAYSTLAWGIILITTPACYNFAGIASNRFLLGFVEAAVNPGFVLLMSMWYTVREQPVRLEAYYCTNGIATMFGGLIGYAVGHINSGLPRWMYVFLIFGACSLAGGLYALIVLPDMPSKAKFLDERQRSIAVDRVARNRQGVKNSHFSTHQARQTLADPKTWILFVMAIGAQIPNSALTSFTSLIIKSFGFGTLGTQYLQIPGGAVQFLSLLGGGIICSRFPNIRCAAMIVANTICILGSALLVGLPETAKWGRLVAIWLCYFQGLGFSMSLTMVSSNVAGYTKKQLTGAILFTGYCVGNIIGPQTFKSSEAPGYQSAYIAMLVGYCVKLGMVVLLYFYMVSVNKKRDREAALNGTSREAEEKAAIANGLHDMTELDNKGFRYVL